MILLTYHLFRLSTRAVPFRAIELGIRQYMNII